MPGRAVRQMAAVLHLGRLVIIESTGYPSRGDKRVSSARFRLTLSDGFHFDGVRMSSNKLDTSWFDLKNYDVLQALKN